LGVPVEFPSGWIRTPAGSAQTFLSERMEEVLC
jgi:hypothetical protein